MVHVTGKLCFFLATQVKPNIPLGTSSGTTASTRRWPGTALPQPPKVGSKTKARPGWRWWDFTELAGRVDLCFFLEGWFCFFCWRFLQFRTLIKGFCWLKNVQWSIHWPCVLYTCFMGILQRLGFSLRPDIVDDTWGYMWSDVCMIFVFAVKSVSMYPEYPAFNGWLSKLTQFHHFSFWPYMALFIVPHAYKYIFHFSTCDCKTPSGSPLFQSDSPPSMEVNPAASSASLASKADKDRQASNGLVQPATSYSPCSIMEPSCAQSLGLRIIMAMNLELRNDSKGNSILCHTLSISKWGPSLSTNSRIQQEIWRYFRDISAIA